MTTWRFMSLITFLLLLLVFTQYHLWFDAGGVRDLLSLKHAYLAQLKENEHLKHLNDELSLQIERLKKSPDSTEGRARSELGMIKKDETFYQVVKRP